MPIPTQPRMSRELLRPPSSRESRTCSHCAGPLSPHGRQALRTASVGAIPDGVLLVELFSCPHCGKVEFYTPPPAPTRTS